MHSLTLFIFALRKPDSLFSVMASALGANHPAPHLHPLSFSLPLLLTLSPLPGGSLSVSTDACIRRLHMVIVDLCHPRKTPTRTEKQFYQQITELRNERGGSVTPIPLCNQEEWRCRYVFGKSLDDSDKPVYLIWPERTRSNGLWLLDVARNQYHNLCQTASICKNLGLENFYAAFGLGCSRDLRVSSARAFGISENDISEVCSVPGGIAKRLRPLMVLLARLTSRKKPKLTCRK